MRPPPAPAVEVSSIVLCRTDVPLFMAILVRPSDRGGDETLILRGTLVATTAKVAGPALKAWLLTTTATLIVVDLTALRLIDRSGGALLQNLHLRGNTGSASLRFIQPHPPDSRIRAVLKRTAITGPHHDQILRTAPGPDRRLPPPDRRSAERKGAAAMEATHTEQGSQPLMSITDRGPLSGFELFCGEKALGTIEEIIRLGTEPYYLVDTRHWTFGERRLVPATAIDHVGAEDGTASTSLDVEIIRVAPDFNPFRLDDGDYGSTLHSHYSNRTTRSNAVDLIGEYT